MSKHKHAEVIKQWADGATVEAFSTDEGVWVTLHAPFYWNEQHEYRVKPAKVYPVTQMTRDEMAHAICNDGKKGSVAGDGAIDTGMRVANAVLRHAIDAGQVVPINEVLETVDRMLFERCVKRDMAIAEAVRSWYRVQFTTVSQSIAQPDLKYIIAHVNP